VISDSERRKLDEIEMDLRRDDLDLARQFDEWRHRPRHRPILAVLAVLAVLVAVGLTWVLCGTAAGVIALSGTGCIGVAAALWRGRGRRRGSR
jgi:hypothetical protein